MAKDFKNNPILDFLTPKQNSAVQNVRQNLTYKSSVQNNRTNSTEESSVRNNRTKCTDKSSVQNSRTKCTDKSSVHNIANEFEKKPTRNARFDIRLENKLKKKINKLAHRNNISTNELIVQVLEAVTKGV